MDIQTRTRGNRPSRRQQLLEGQWQQQRYERHRERVRSAGPRIDDSRPVSLTLEHVQLKAKKRQKEAERWMEVMTCNLILLRHLAEIAASKRVDDGNRIHAMHWKDYYASMLLVRKQQLERIKLEMTAAAADGKNGRAKSEEREQKSLKEKTNPKEKKKKAME